MTKVTIHYIKYIEKHLKNKMTTGINMCICYHEQGTYVTQYNLYIAEFPWTVPVSYAFYKIDKKTANL